MKNKLLQAPFPYFGGKSKIASKVWQIFGQPKNYIEPFFGSGAVLLGRPDFTPNMNKMHEIINDKDGFVCNFWRSIKFSPKETAYWCNWPTNQLDLNARTIKLLSEDKSLHKQLKADPEWHDAKLAGYWVYCVCNTPRIWTRKNTIPLIGYKGRGIVIRRKTINKWFESLSYRLQNVKVVCGDWKSVLGGNWQTDFGTVGIFLDPPYFAEKQDTKIYKNQIAKKLYEEILEYCIKSGQNKKYKIILCGYEEYEELVKKHNWKAYKWKSSGGFGLNENRKREILYISPNCNYESSILSFMK